MARIRELAERCRLTDGDLIGLAREVAEDARLRHVEDLTAQQVVTLTAVLELLAAPAPAPIEWYHKLVA